MNHCLVSGCTGFIGRHLVKALLGRGVTVRGLTRGPADDIPMPGVELRRGDLARPDTLADITRDIDTIIHAAGQAHAEDADDEVHRQTTVEGTRHLLAAAEVHSVQRFVFISSIKAMPEPGDACLDESDQRLPTDTYGLSRRKAEDLVLDAGRRTGMHVSILRPALVYGPGNKGNLFSMMHWINRGLFPPIPDTSNVRSMVDVRDLVQAILLAAEKPAANGKAFIITDNMNYSTHRIYAALRSAFDKSVPPWSVPAGLLRVFGKAGDAYEAILRRPAPFNSDLCSRLLNSACYRSNCAEQDLGFRAEYSFEDAVSDMVDEYRNRRAMEQENG
ncbi:MAG: NAD-dependent epimerase/dehydratase family protein [Gammaproteobacteria bacterium]|nr:NAD-dependent epimerase/dehydratase family protein [Gammaproteobacteria bacterium]